MKWVRGWRAFWNWRVAPAVLAVAGLMVVQFYVVRELLAAEVLFALAFLCIILLGVAFYFLGSIAERGADVMEAGLHVGAARAQRGYHDLEEASRKWIANARHLHAHR